MTIQHIADYIANLPPISDFGRPLVDKTGLTGTFDFSLSVTPVRRRPSASEADAQSDAGGPTFEEAMKEQLGLKFKPTKADTQVLVIDHVEKPSGN